MSSRGWRRITKLSWWFIVLFLIAIGIAIYVIIHNFVSATVEFHKLGDASVLSIFISSAYADTATNTPFDPKPLVMMCIIGTLVITLLASLGIMLTSTRAENVTAAGDITKLLLGFFVGVGTKYLG